MYKTLTTFRLAAVALAVLARLSRRGVIKRVCLASMLLVGSPTFAAVPYLSLVMMKCRPTTTAALLPRWIGSSFPVPEFTTGFVLAEKPQTVTLDLAVAGWYELTVNGVRVGDAVLEPAVVAYMVKTPAFKIDLSPFVRVGTNEIRVLVGPGWYGCRVENAWRFHDADWIMNPCIRAEITADGKQVSRSDATWRQVRSPIVFSQFRNGEYYDARLEDEVVSSNATELVYPPRGAITYVEPADPVRTFEALRPKAEAVLADGRIRYDFGENLAGWCEIEVVGERGAKVEIDYDELYRTNGLPACGTDWFVRSGRANHDEYTLAGRAAGERWHPRFVYHGLRYAWVRTSGRVTLKSICARRVGSDFRKVGDLKTDNAAFARLHEATMRSYRANFVGIPTDCPYREKNGWTADAQLAMETGLWNFDASKSYRNYVRMIIDTQQANGQVATIVPNSIRYGFTWGTGPAWDMALFEMPWQLYRFRGDDTLIREGYPAMVRYLGYLATKVRDDGTIGFGLGDWCAADFSCLADRDVLETAIAVGIYDHATRFAEHLGKDDDAVRWRESAETMRGAFRRRFCRGGGHVAKDRTSELALALAYGCLPAAENAAAAKLLVERVRKNRHRADFGILGAKFAPRMLAEYGYGDDAFELFVQPEYPGWQSMLKGGDGTLWESFDGGGSHNHIMFGDLSAWAYEYAAGIRPLEPGFRKVLVKPVFPRQCKDFSVECRLPTGVVAVSWSRLDDGRIGLELKTAPGDLSVDVDVPEHVKVMRY